MLKTVCIDFDGVIHSYTTPWMTSTVIPDPPVNGAFEFIQDCLRCGFIVAVFSARSASLDGRNAMAKWFSEHGFPLTHHLSFPEHKPSAVIYIDDRGFHFQGQFPSMDYIKTFLPWNREEVVRKDSRYIPPVRRYGLGSKMMPNPNRPLRIL